MRRLLQKCVGTVVGEYLGNLERMLDRQCHPRSSLLRAVVLRKIGIYVFIYAFITSFNVGKLK